jgi:hypothetical protein
MKKRKMTNDKKYKNAVFRQTLINIEGLEAWEYQDRVQLEALSRLIYSKTFV